MRFQRVIIERVFMKLLKGHPWLSGLGAGPLPGFNCRWYPYESLVVAGKGIRTKLLLCTSKDTLYASEDCPKVVLCTAVCDKLKTIAMVINMKHRLHHCFPSVL